MLVLLSEAGRSFLRAFAASLLILLPGVLSAPNLNGATGLGIAALIASVAAGLKAIQVFVPQLSFKSLLPAKFRVWGNYVDSFARAFFATLLVSVLGWLAMPALSFERSVLVGLLVGAVTAGFRALQGSLTPGEPPQPQAGLTTPPPQA